METADCLDEAGVTVARRLGPSARRTVEEAKGAAMPAGLVFRSHPVIAMAAIRCAAARGALRTEPRMAVEPHLAWRAIIDS